ncbi:PREDICTED: uncharacterized protein LOC108803307 [Nanorana parkeri]|uniref:uncharacterized protein LOC108803307 n=1 Tax=Nanorana parkeri TaxID=125878 RepID=UPI00085428D2|nr:PREDICTED: uncharacterized protein LOC108803307 [Nanorana parkeri]
MENVEMSTTMECSLVSSYVQLENAVMSLTMGQSLVCSSVELEMSLTMGQSLVCSTWDEILLRVMSLQGVDPTSMEVSLGTGRSQEDGILGQVSPLDGDVSGHRKVSGGQDSGSGLSSGWRCLRAQEGLRRTGFWVRSLLWMEMSPGTGRSQKDGILGQVSPLDGDVSGHRKVSEGRDSGSGLSSGWRCLRAQEGLRRTGFWVRSLLWMEVSLGTGRSQEDGILGQVSPLDGDVSGHRKVSEGRDSGSGLSSGWRCLSGP